MHRFIRLLLVAAGAAPVLAAATPPEPLLTPSLAPTEVALTRHKAGTFYIDGLIEGYGAVSLLLDTGSSYLVINETILAALQRSHGAEYTRDLDGLMADGSRRVIPLYRVSALRVGADCWIHDVEAAVFPSAVRPILGMNILARLAPFTVSAEPPQLAVNRCQAPLAQAVVVAPAEAGTALAP